MCRDFSKLNNISDTNLLKQCLYYQDLTFLPSLGIVMGLGPSSMLLLSIGMGLLRLMESTRMPS